MENKTNKDVETKVKDGVEQPNLEGIEDGENNVTEVDEKALRIQQLEIDMHELVIRLEMLEFDVPEDEEELAKRKAEIVEVKQQYRILKDEYKVLTKKEHKTVWDKIPIWMIFYAMIQIVLCFPFISSFIWVNFANTVIGWFSSSLSNIPPGTVMFKAMLVLIVYSLPLINMLVTWIIYANFIKKDFDRLVFRFIWIAQGVMTLATMLWLFFDILLPNVLS